MEGYITWLYRCPVWRHLRVFLDRHMFSRQNRRMKNEKIKPAYQGQLDVFCAPYAVINGLRYIYATRLLACRQLFHNALLDLAQDKSAFRDALLQETDYTAWIDRMLDQQHNAGMLTSESPFTGPVDVTILWETLTAWLSQGKKRVALFQFIRYFPLTDFTIKHWTCCKAVEKNTLLLFDSSLDAGSIHRIDKKMLLSSPCTEDSEKVFIVPHTVRLIRIPHEKKEVASSKQRFTVFKG